MEASGIIHAREVQSTVKETRQHYPSGRYLNFKLKCREILNQWLRPSPCLSPCLIRSPFKALVHANRITPKGARTETSIAHCTCTQLSVGRLALFHKQSSSLKQLYVTRLQLCILLLPCVPLSMTSSECESVILV